MSLNHGNLSDEELVLLCQKRLPGDPRAFTALVSRYEGRVLATCFRLMGNMQEAEDQAQEVFIRVYRGLFHFQGRSSFSTWLFQVTVNTCRTALKKRSRRPQVLEASLLNLETYLPSPETPEETTLTHIEQDTAQQALQMLNPEQRIILILRETNGLEYKEIAEILEINLSAAKMRVMRARLAWQKAYQKILEQNQ